MRNISEEPLLSMNQGFDSFRHAIEAHTQAPNLITSSSYALVAPRIKPTVRNSARGFAQLHDWIGDMTGEQKAKRCADQQDRKQVERHFEAKAPDETDNGLTGDDNQRRV
jgi:hypothetical protein